MAAPRMIPPRRRVVTAGLTIVVAVCAWLLGASCTRAMSTPPASPVTVRSPGSEPAFRPRVIVKLIDGIGLDYTATKRPAFQGRDRDYWNRLRARYPQIGLAPLFDGVAPARIVELAERARERSTRARRPYQPPDFLSYFFVDAGEGVDQTGLVQMLRGWPIVQDVTLQHRSVVATTDPSNDMLSDEQIYIHPPVSSGPGEITPGVDALYGWEHGADGEGIHIVDIEKGWDLCHEDLPATIAQVYGLPPADQSERDHGTKTLGILAAQDNDRGIVGIAHRAVVELASSEVSIKPDGQREENLPGAILAAVDRLSFGDVLVLEVQEQSPPTLPEDTTYFYLPVDAIPVNRAALGLATALGIVVVEAAANNATRLDDVPSEYGTFEDIGTIIVAACNRNGGKLSTSNYGSMVSCYALGEAALTSIPEGECPSGDCSMCEASSSYGDYEKTSAATAIVGGVAAAVQSYVERRCGYRLDAYQMRRVLTAYGTPPVNHTDQIGIMPNIRTIIEALDCGTELLVRDDLEDDGAPHDGASGLSPDIIVRNEAVADPDAEFGEASGTRDDEYLSDSPATDLGPFIYVRVQNVADQAIPGARVEVWTAPTSPCTPPVWWWKAGPEQTVDVPANHGLAVAGPFKMMDLDSLGYPGDFQVLAMVREPDVPFPDLNEIRFEDDTGDPALAAYERFLYQNRWVACRNAMTLSSFVLLRGAVWGSGTEFDIPRCLPKRPEWQKAGLQIETRLDGDIKTWIEFPPDLLKRVPPPVPPDGGPPPTPLRHKNWIAIPLHASKPLVVKGLVLPRDQADHFRVIAVRGGGPANGRIIVRQMVYGPKGDDRGLETGRFVILLPSQKR